MADNAIALGIKVPDAMASLGSVMGVAQGAQGLQSGAVDLERKRATLQSDILRARAESSRAQTSATGEAADLQEKQAFRELFKDGPQAFAGPDGRLDYNKLLPAVMKVAPTKGMEFINHMYAADSAASASQKALLGLNGEQRTMVGQYVNALKGESPETVKKKLDAIAEQIPQLKPTVEATWKYHLQPHAKDQTTFDGQIQKVAQGVMSIQAQNEANTPGGPGFDTGQATGTVNVKPMAGPVGPVPGTVIAKEIPVGTPDYDPNTRTPGIVGPNATPPRVIPPPGPRPKVVNSDRVQILSDELSAEQARPANTEAEKGRKAANISALERELQAVGGNPPKRVQTGPGLGEAAAVGGSIESMNRDFEETRKNASTAAQDIGVLQNIKKYSKGAITGVAADRRALANSIADYLGIPSAQIEKTDTDLLAKNANMLALVGGNTDAARSLAEAANPNMKMNAEAIRRAADQIIAQKKMSVEKQKFIQKHKDSNSPEAYNKALAEWNSVADPRILQLSDMSPEEKKQLRGSMSEKEFADFRKKIQKLHSMGVTP